jgi:hypothetical protein
MDHNAVRRWGESYLPRRSGCRLPLSRRAEFPDVSALGGQAGICSQMNPTQSLAPGARRPLHFPHRASFLRRDPQERRQIKRN